MVCGQPFLQLPFLLFSTMKNYFDLPKEYSEESFSQIVILPIPFEQTTTWLKGTVRGPDAILEASTQVELYDIEMDNEVYKKGIFSVKPIKAKIPEEMVNCAYGLVKSFLDKDKFVVSLGGEHSVSLGPIKAHAEKFENLSVLQFDAHSDMRDSYEGSKHSHASIMARAKEHVDNIVSIGIRSMDISEKNALPKEKLFLAQDICNASNNYVDAIVDQLTDNVYVTFDVDVFDSSIMPSTGTPEPGGLNWYQVLNILKAVAKKKKVVGCDFVELLPNDVNKAPDFLVAKLIYKFLCYCF